MQFWLLQYSFSIFPIPLSWRVSYIIYLLLDHLDPTLVDHLNLHLSAYPIRHPLWFSVSCGSQGNIVQGSSQRKCGQESSCSAFNAVVAAFLKIFLRSHHLRRSWHTSLSLELPRRSSWSLEHVFETYLSCPKRYSFSDHPSIYISLIESWAWTIHYHSLVLKLISSRSRPKAQYMI